MTLGELIKERRTALGLSQRALGVMIGVDGQTISNIEMQHTRTLKLKNLQQLPKALEVPMEVVTAAAKFADEMVAVFIPREDYELIEAAAKAASLDVVPFIVKRTTPAPRDIKKPIAKEHGAGPASRTARRRQSPQASQ